MPASVAATVQIGTYNPTTDAFTLLLDLNDYTNIWQLNGSPDIGVPEKNLQRAGNARTDGQRITLTNYGNRQLNLTMHFGKSATYAAIADLVNTFILAVEQPPFVLRYAPPSPNANVEYSYFDVLAVTHNADKFDPKRIINGTMRVIAVFECAPYIRGDRKYLQNLVMNPGAEMPHGGGIATSAPTVFNDSFATTNAYHVVSGSSPSVASNVMTIVSGSQLSFGSTAWGALEVYQLRLKYASAATFSIYLHYVDGNNYLQVQISTNSITLTQVIAGVAHSIATAAPALTNTNFYWLVARQFPLGYGFAPYVTAALFNDSAGSIGTAVASGSVSGRMVDALTAVNGQMGFAVGGANQLIGGAFSNVHIVSLFGPGGWIGPVIGTGTGVPSGAWDGSRWEMGMNLNGVAGTQTYGGGPVTSFGSFRIDIAPAGTVDTWWTNYSGGTAAGTCAMATPSGDTLGVSAAYKTSGLGSNAVVEIDINEYDGTGSFLRNTTIGSHTGNQTSWTTISGNITMGANTVYGAILLRVRDSNAAASANGTVWFDNAQVWDQTTTGMTTMGYCELRFPNSPAQLLISGLVGQFQAPAAIYWGTTFSSFSAGATISFWIGLRARASAGTQLCSPSTLTTLYTPGVDTAAFGGATHAIASATSMVIEGASYIAQKISDLRGVYRILMRVKTTQVAGSLGATIAQSQAWQAGTTDIGVANGKIVTPAFGASATWGITDAGLVTFPSSPLGVAVDQTAIAAGALATFSDPSGAGTTFTQNFLALAPADENGSLMMGQITVPDNIVASEMMQVALDGLNAQYQRDDIGAGASLYYVASSGAITNTLTPAQAVVGPGISGATAAGGTYGVNITQDSVPQVNPQAKAGVTLGVNQGMAMVIDSAGVIYPFMCDIVYTPLYLYPRP